MATKKDVEKAAPDESKTCFVLTPIGQPDSPARHRADRLCDDILAPAVEGFGLTILRGDKLQKPGLITVQLVEAITDARVIFADLVDPNPNVYYELGLAEAFHKPVIRFSADTEALPFDVRDMRTIPLPKMDDGSVDVKHAMHCIKTVKSWMPAILEGVEKPVSVVTLAERQAQFEDLARTVEAGGDDQGRLLAQLAAQMDELRATVESKSDGPTSGATEPMTDRFRVELLPDPGHTHTQADGAKIAQALHREPAVASVAIGVVAGEIFADLLLTKRLTATLLVKDGVADSVLNALRGHPYGIGRIIPL